MHQTLAPIVLIAIWTVANGLSAESPAPRSASVGDRFPALSQLPSRPEFPDPLVMLDGRRVTTRGQWVQERRPELLALFQHYMYGVLPPQPAKVVGKIEREDRRALGGQATLKWRPRSRPA